MNVSLYINSALADLGDASFLLWNYTREDAEQPAAVKNSFTQSVTLPSTKANDAIFGGAWRADRTSDVFNALKRTPFILRRDDGTIVQRGYLRLDSVATSASGVVSYNVTLYGGLGGFFYSLMYNADGTKRTLADMTWTNGTDTAKPSAVAITMTAADVAPYWTGTAQDYGGPVLSDKWLSAFNFAPCNNGIPTEDFSADKAYYMPGTTLSQRLQNLYVTRTDSGTTYTTHPDGNGGILIDLGTSYTEWEMQCLMASQQRPVWRVLAFLRSLALSANKWSFDISQGVDNSATIERLWCTLSNKGNASATSWADLLKGSLTPADYLLGLAKVYGFVFDFDPIAGEVTMMTRNEYFSEDTTPMDISARIARDKGITLTPYVVDTFAYLFTWEGVGGAYESEYSEVYGETFGQERVTTGVEFNRDTTEVMQGLPYRGAADVLEVGSPFAYYGVPPTSGTTYTYYLFKAPYIGSASWELYAASGNSLKSLSCTPTKMAFDRIGYATGGADFAARPQFMDAEGKAIDGANVLLLFADRIRTPHYSASGEVLGEAFFRMCDSNDAMLALNGGKACWDVSMNAGEAVTLMPSFRRWVAGEEMNLNFGAVAEVATKDAPPNECIYDDRWQAYIADRFNKDTKQIECYVDFRGIQVDEGLFRRFFYFDNAVWVLNAVTNHSLTTPSLTQCTFVQVQDIAAYSNGQIIV